MNVEERAFARCWKRMNPKHGPKKVAREVAKAFGRGKPPSPSSVSKLLSGKTFADGALTRAKPTGRPPKSTAAEDSRLARVAKKAVLDSNMEEEVPARVILEKWAPAQRMSAKTVKRRIKKLPGRWGAYTGCSI